MSLGTFSAQAQPVFNHPRYLDQPGWNSLENWLLTATERAVDKLPCVASIAFVKFEVTSQSKIENIVFSKTIHKELRDAVEKGLITSEKHWSWKGNEDTTIIKRQTFLLPIFYINGSPCNGFLHRVIEKDKKVRKQFFQYLQYKEPLQNMLEFEDGSSYEALDCILLDPFRIQTIS